MGQLMLIAVNVEDGKSQSTVEDSNGEIVLNPPLRVMGYLDSDKFDEWVRNEMALGEKSLIKPPHVHRYSDGTSIYVGTILFNRDNASPRICVDFNGVPICYP